jgi:uncharacterized protein (TIGR03084 family)
VNVSGFLPLARVFQSVVDKTRKTTMVDMHALCMDLHAEHVALDTLLVDLNDAAWDIPTPAPGWMVRDHLSHLGTTDRTATLAATEPQRFVTDVVNQPREQRAVAQREVGRSMSGAALLAWWRAGRSAMLDVLRRLDATTRLPWFGPPMSALSFATARLMETWAHGQDLVDALGLTRPATARLRHVAHLGVLARPFSYTTRGLPAPTDPVYVALRSPSGTRWTWGEATAANRITGPALDFCLVVTQRCHVADTSLQAVGPVATTWMRLAQAFAGPPGEGRQPGQFARS